MSEDNRKHQEKQEKKDELTEIDLDQASGGLLKGPNGERIYEGIRPESGRKK
jgi:hypothetical protein